MKVLYPLLWLLALATAPCLAGAEDSPADSDQVRRAVHVCNACHGEFGSSHNESFPNLAAQQRQYTIAQLQAFRDQQRAEPDTRAYMWGVSSLLDDEAIRGLAEYYAEQPPVHGKGGNSALLKRGRKIYEEGIPAKGVRPCRACHGDEAEGANVFPRLAGQEADYVVKELKVFRTRLRLHGVLMGPEARGLTDTDMRAVAVYVQSK